MPKATGPAGSSPSGQDQAPRYLAAPQFRDTVASYCREIIATDMQAWPTTKLFHQLGRYMVSFLLIHHYQDWHRHDGPPATLSRLQASCPLSPRQTAAIVAGLRAGKLLTADSPAISNPHPASATTELPFAFAKVQSSHARTLVPAPPIIQAIARPMLAILAAADQLDQKSRARLFTGDFALQSELIYRSARFVELHGTLLQAFPRVRHFTEKDCGYLILCAVMSSALSPSAPVPLSCRYLAQHFRISRSHASNLLAHAAASQWFATDGRGRLAYIAPDLILEFEQWAAAEMAHYAEIAEDMLGNSGDDARTRANLKCSALPHGK